MITPTNAELVKLLRNEVAEISLVADHPSATPVGSRRVLANVMERLRAAADALEAAPATPAECSTLDHRWISNLPYATCLCGEFRRADSATPAPAPDVRRWLELYAEDLRESGRSDARDFPTCAATYAEIVAYLAAPLAPPAAPTGVPA